ncbi:Ca2+-binding RTX toxin-like protein [Bradyrhizobium sp. AZCC 1588]|uniref:spondin domain-containing protein n=1 Tax=unclassified Bradyrhizobium TaxID=2631580 RepID=UPI002FF171EF
MTDLRVTIKNTSESGGTFLTPAWLGFHDGSFDLFNVGEAASPGLEQLAEDGAATILGTELVAADADGQGLVVPGAAGPIATQETTSAILDVDGVSNPFASFGSMIIPSNDAFIGTDEALRLFDAQGRFLGETTITFAGTDAYDAGTEVNTELDAAFINQTAPNTGLDESGVVHLHPGFNGSLGNPVGEGDQMILGGVNEAGEFIDPVAADFTRPGAQLAEVHINTVRVREGTDGRDLIIGRGDDDLVTAGGGDDTVFGGAGWDVVDGGTGDDKIFGGRGDDLIAGGEGDDWIVGGAGADTSCSKAATATTRSWDSARTTRSHSMSRASTASRTCLLTRHNAIPASSSTSATTAAFSCQESRSVVFRPTTCCSPRIDAVDRVRTSCGAKP